MLFQNMHWSSDNLQLPQQKMFEYKLLQTEKEESPFPNIKLLIWLLQKWSRELCSGRYRVDSKFVFNSSYLATY